MIRTIKTGVAAVLLILATSCKKENSSMQSSVISNQSTSQSLTTDAGPEAVRIGTQVWKKKISLPVIMPMATRYRR